MHRLLYSRSRSLPHSNTPRRVQVEEYDPFDRDGRAKTITSTFSAAHIPLSQLQHPTKSQVTAVEAYELLPDSDLWANEYDLIRFGEDPGDKGTVCSSFSLFLPRSVLTNRHVQNELPRLGPDPRLPRAIFRDLTETLGEDLARVSFFLPTDDSTAVAYTQKRMAGEASAEDEVRFPLFVLAFIPSRLFFTLSSLFFSAPLPSSSPSTALGIRRLTFASARCTSSAGSATTKSPPSVPSIKNTSSPSTRARRSRPPRRTPLDRQRRRDEGRERIMSRSVT
jgi:hypothetical protein